MKKGFSKLLRLGITVFVAIAASAACSISLAGDAPISLEYGDVRLECDPAFGTFLRILDRASGIELAPPAGMAENFRLTIQLPDKKTATILGKDQKVSRASFTANGLVLKWDAP